MRVDVQFTGFDDAWLRNDHGKEAGANDIPDAAKTVCEGTIKHFFLYSFGPFDVCNKTPRGRVSDKRISDCVQL